MHSCGSDGNQPNAHETLTEYIVANVNTARVAKTTFGESCTTSDVVYRDKGKKKAVAQGSDVFTMFEKTQLQEFKEAFEMIDSNRDGFIDKNDLKST